MHFSRSIVVCTALSFAACGAPQQDDFGALESAATLTSADGRVKVKDRGTKSDDGETFVLAITVPKTASEVAASVGDEELGQLKPLRTGRVDVALDRHALGQALAGAQVHVLTAAQAGSRLFGSVDVVASVRLSKTALALKSLAADAEAGRFEVLLEAKAPVQSVQPSVGTARVVPGTETMIAWQVRADDVAALVLQGKAASVKLQQGAKATSVLATWSAAVQAPGARTVPADFDLAFARLAEAAPRKLQLAETTEAQQGVLLAIAEAVDGSADAQLALNVSRILVGEGGYTVLQGSGQVGRGGEVHGESWWLPLPVLRQRLESALHGLPLEVRWEGAKR